MTTVGEALVAELERRGVDTVFGIPGVHTVELYRGLSASKIRHVTPRHEQGAGFMADGYARASGRPGVAFVITGPGVTNTITPMAQALADSVPMLVISSVNERANLGRRLGHLHELPDQLALMSAVALSSTRVDHPEQLCPTLDAAFALFAGSRPGPVHIEIPLDVLALPAVDALAPEIVQSTPIAAAYDIQSAAEILTAAKTPVILAGGGCRMAEAELCQIAERLDAPVVQTTNARGLMHNHALSIPASPSLAAVRKTIAAADVVLAVGTELGPTDYDMYRDDEFPDMLNLIRIDICPAQLDRHPATVRLNGDAAHTLTSLFEALAELRPNSNSGVLLAETTRTRAFAEISPEMQLQVTLLNAIRDAVPNALLIGDSTQPVYAGNLFYAHDRAGGWFNASTGYGALGYGIPAAVGASIARPETSVICITGDGGAQFTLPELMAATDENTPVVFMVWNNHGYQEIETSMDSAGVTVVGCDPTPPDFESVAHACQMPYRKCEMAPDALRDVLRDVYPRTGPMLIEVLADH